MMCNEFSSCDSDILCAFNQTHHTTVTQLLQSSMRLLDCPWLQQQHRGLVETCIRTLAMTGETGLLQGPEVGYI